MRAERVDRPRRLDRRVVVFRKRANARKAWVLDRTIKEGAVVPAHWLTEVANALQMGVRRGRFLASRLPDSLGALADLTIDREASAFPTIAAVVETANRHDLTVYDAAYLELAKRRGLPLATLDQALANAARQEGVEVLP